ncbi:glucose-6-phosphate dehydrogenase [Peptostreptococcus faecalis]|uniref:glucose-6-phosphate dehydrogenase n=1 Tax=Peptostreptococcus faecalis TaxID=2045015 RepID=UPI002E8DDC70|nr:glucose-6-phosphate dehydrogenase [Peptostreptococcus faecalis]
MTGQEIMNNKGMLIFGGTGDLAYRKLFPALYNLHCLGELPSNYKIIGIGRREYSNSEYIEIVKNWTKENSRLKYTEDDFSDFQKRISYYKMDMKNSDEYIELSTYMDSLELDGGVIYYYAVSPELFSPITKGLKKTNINRKSAKVIIEKPFGETLDSAREIYMDLKKYFKKDNIYHIDHYLGKEMIINIMTLRFENSIFKGVWNKDFIEKVEINAYETLGVENRGGYYDKSGALADMIQNHLFQIMSIVAMEEPEDSSSEAIKSAQQKVFKKLKKINSKKIDEILMLAQYNGYRDEERVSKDSTTETYAQLKVEIENDRWKGVPFYLRTGKMLSQRESEVIVSFKSTSENAHRNNLIIKIQPDEGVKLNFNIKKPGTSNVIEEVNMDFCQSCILDNRENTPEAYERLIKSCMESDRSLFSQWKQIELSWHYINDLIDSYKKYSNKLYFYEPGSKGPIENN